MARFKSVDCLAAVQDAQELAPKDRVHPGCLSVRIDARLPHALTSLEAFPSAAVTRTRRTLNLEDLHDRVRHLLR